MHALAVNEKHWLLTRDDPRTVFLVCLVVLVLGAFVIPHLVDEGAGARLLAIGWLVVSVAEVIWSGWRLWKFLAARH